MLGVHVAHFRRTDLPHRPEQPAPPYEPYYVPHGPHEVRRVVLAGQVARADPGGAPARALLGGRVVCRKGASCPSCPRKVKIEKLRILPPISVVLYRDSPIENSSNLGQNSKKLNSY